MRIKIRPVRWWRSDEDRFKSRPPYVAPIGAPIAIELLPMDPNVTALLDHIRAEHDREMRKLASALAVPIDLLYK